MPISRTCAPKASVRFHSDNFATTYSHPHIGFQLPTPKDNDDSLVRGDSAYESMHTSTFEVLDPADAIPTEVSSSPDPCAPTAGSDCTNSREGPTGTYTVNTSVVQPNGPNAPHVASVVLDKGTLAIAVDVPNEAFRKDVSLHVTYDGWATISDIPCDYQMSPSAQRDRFGTILAIPQSSFVPNADADSATVTTDTNPAPTPASGDRIADANQKFDAEYGPFVIPSGAASVTVQFGVCCRYPDLGFEAWDTTTGNNNRCTITRTIPAHPAPAVVRTPVSVSARATRPRAITAFEEGRAKMRADLVEERHEEDRKRQERAFAERMRAQALARSSGSAGAGGLGGFGTGGSGGFAGPMGCRPASTYGGPGLGMGSSAFGCGGGAARFAGAGGGYRAYGYGQ